MSKKLLCSCLLLFHAISCFAGQITGKVTDEQGRPLAFASILIKGTTKGTTANSDGYFSMELSPGKYTVTCQYVGYNRLEKSIEVTNEKVVLNFTLTLQQLSLAEVVIRPGAEDPAYAIIRNAIQKRPFYLNQLDRFQCQVYIKGQLRLRAYPKKVFGQEVDFEDGDTSKQKMVYLSETVANYSVQQPNKTKIEVISTKVSGQSDGFGFSAPQIVSFYENIIQIGSNLNPRGFVSPIAAQALQFYRYKYEGSFYEDGKEINRIKVIAKRKFEPAFNGYINITENDWRIHSVQLVLTKESQMEIVDTLRIEQLHVPYDQDTWVIKSQVIYPSIKMFGFDAYGSFVNIYSQFNTSPHFAKNFFGNTFLKIYDSANKKPAVYWDSVRPLSLQPDEIRDYSKKDSLEQVRKDPRYLDSLDRKRNKITFRDFILGGISISNSKKRVFYSIQPVLRSVSFNTVEGWVVNLSGSYFKRPDSNSTSRRSLNFSPTVRYGFSNHHLNASFNGAYNFGKKYFSSISIAGGKSVFQFNNASPITERDNTFTTLVWERNYMKLYEAWFGRIGYSKGIGEGVSISATLQYQDRYPLDNTTTSKWRDRENIEFTSNYPQELIQKNIIRHQSTMAIVALTWQPGGRYIEMPNRKINIGSKYPVFVFTYMRALKGVLEGDTDFDKWRVTISDNLNLKLGGSFRYRIATGGFFRTEIVEAPDYNHLHGNQVILASPYLNSFQLAPYYRYSNIKPFFITAHAEHHFNGLLTNKIPLFRKLNWHLVGGANLFYVNSDQHYSEVFAGLENILKILRVDVVRSFDPHGNGYAAIRVGFRGALSGN